MLTTKIGSRLDQPVLPSGLTGIGAVVGLAQLTGLTGGSDWSKQSPSTTVDFYRIISVNRIYCGISPPHPINIKGHGRLGHPIGQTQTFLSF